MKDREDRLVAYRCAFLSAGSSVDMAEHRAHLMLAAERPADEPVATEPCKPEVPTIVWHHAALSVAVCHLSTRALVLWGDVHHVPEGWIARCNDDGVDGVYEHREDAVAAVELALLSRLAKLTGAE